MLQYELWEAALASDVLDDKLSKDTRSPERLRGAMEKGPPDCSVSVGKKTNIGTCRLRQLTISCHQSLVVIPRAFSFIRLL